MTAAPYGWAGTALAFTQTPLDEIIEDLNHQHSSRFGGPGSHSQIEAWRESVEILRTALSEVRQVVAGAAAWGIVLEYELPFEGGRRPDAVILAGGAMVVIEFKQSNRPTQSGLDQVAAYSRDLVDYHSASAGIPCTPVLCITRAGFISGDFDPVLVAGREELGGFLAELQQSGTIDLEAWLKGDYEPLPTLVAAARRIFREEPLPHVKSAISSGIPDTLALLARIASEAEERGERHLVFVDGVPGSGKTLVGLRLIYELPAIKGRGILLSGNGPLVAVLQHALKSSIFVRDLHKYIDSYGLRGRAPKEHLVVFDEAQRAWDKGYMHYKRQVLRSEPELLLSAGDRLPGWAVFVGLVGTGQEIHVGEEGGIEQWRDAAVGAEEGWIVHTSERLSSFFGEIPVEVHKELSLTASLRSHRAEHLHEWVDRLLQGNIPMARAVASRLEKTREGFDLYVTRSLEDAKEYARLRYIDDPIRTYGLLAPSRAKTPARYGIDNGFQALKNMKLGPWFNADREDPHSAMRLEVPVTEFQVQGLEIDLPIFCWGEDYLWSGTTWERRPARTRYPKENPERLLENAYRVLLTRGRDGLVVFLPPEPEFDATHVALLAAGMQPLMLFPDSGAAALA